MKKVFSIENLDWSDLKLQAARGFEYKALIGAEYTSAYNVELVRLEPGDESVTHVEPYRHAFYFLSGNGEVTIENETSAVQAGTVCLINAGEKHSLLNTGAEIMLIITIYDPPRVRET